MTAPPRAAPLLSWYDRHARDLPWRIGPRDSLQGQKQDPYKVWLSEIMLQQTTVAAVKPYYQNFVARWPTVEDLAAASEDEVRAAWAGLGYYRRAANLHACAKQVAERLNGRFPATAAHLRDLPGIGAYTSAAIGAIAFGEPIAVVDGNVERVVARLFRIATPLPKAKPQIAEKVAAMLPSERPGDFAQAMMDLGATICTPKNPSCLPCPWFEPCAARRAGDAEHYPVKLPKKVKPQRFGAALVIEREDGAIWCEKRPLTGLLPGMTQVPTTPWTADAPAPFNDAKRVGQVTHTFTHFTLTLDVYRRSSALAPPTKGWWSPPAQIRHEAWPSVMVKVVKQAIPALAGNLRAAKD